MKPHEIYRKNAKAKARKSAAKKKGMNRIQMILLGTVGLLGFVCSLYGISYPKQILTSLKQIEVTALSLSHAGELDKKPDQKGESGKKETKPSSGKDKADKDKKEEIVFKKESHIRDIIEREKQLDEREKKVTELEAKLQQQEVELQKRIEELNEIRRSVASKLKDRVKEDNQSIDKLVGIYSNMKPQNAAYLLMQLEEDLAVKVLKKMKKQVAGKVLNFLDPKKAKVLSEMYSGY